MRKFLLAVALMACASTALAYNHVYAYAQKGGQVVVVAGFTSQTKIQRTFPGATIDVYNTGGLVHPTIYSTNAGAAKANPFTASTTDGSFDFYVADGRYDITFSGAGITTSCGGAGQLPCIPAFTWTDIVLGGGGTGSGSVFNIKDYGAVADCTTYNDTAVGAAFAAAIAANGAVYIPSAGLGVSNCYRMKNPLTATLSTAGSYLRVYGDGVSSALWWDSMGAPADMLTFDCAGAAGKCILSLEDFSIGGDSSTRDGLVFNTVDGQANHRNVTVFSAARNAIRLDGTTILQTFTGGGYTSNAGLPGVPTYVIPKVGLYVTGTSNANTFVGSSFMGVQGAVKTVSAIANAGGLYKITIVGHGYATNDWIGLVNATGLGTGNCVTGSATNTKNVYTCPNGAWKITKVDNDNFTLNNSVYTAGPYTGSGKVARGTGVLIDSGYLTNFHGGNIENNDVGIVLDGTLASRTSIDHVAVETNNEISAGTSLDLQDNADTSSLDTWNSFGGARLTVGSAINAHASTSNQISTFGRSGTARLGIYTPDATAPYIFSEYSTTAASGADLNIAAGGVGVIRFSAAGDPSLGTGGIAVASMSQSGGAALLTVSNDLTVTRNLTITGSIYTALALSANGQTTYCSDCDPPSNPPVACTHAGAQTGAMATRINGTNICHY